MWYLEVREFSIRMVSEMNSTQEWKIGDYRELIHTIPDKSIDLLLTDPPYNNLRVSNPGWDKQRYYMKKIEDLNLNQFNVTEFLNLVEPKLKHFHAYIFSNKSILSDYINWIEGRKYNWNLLIMAKHNPVPAINYKYLSDKEYILFIREPGKCYWNNDLPIKSYRSVKRINIGKKLIHPAQKPLNIIEDLLQVSSRHGDTILDPFLGYGTTLEACASTNRNFTGFDILDEWEPYYHKIIDQNKSMYKLSEIFKKDLSHTPPLHL